MIMIIQGRKQTILNMEHLWSCLALGFPSSGDSRLSLTETPNIVMTRYLIYIICALTLLIGWQEGHLVCKN